MVAVLAEAARSETREAIEASIRDSVAAINDSIEKHARIGAVIVSEEPWSIENEVLTPTLKIKRDKIDEHFGETGERLARQAAEQREMLVHWACACSPSAETLRASPRQS
jgi:long-chain acyl-CoA synthetase